MGKTVQRFYPPSMAPSMYIPTHTPHSHPLPHSSSFCHSVSIDMQHHYLLFTGNTTSIHCR